MGQQALQYDICRAQHPKMAPMESHKPHHGSIGNFTVLAFLVLPEIVMSFLVRSWNMPHKIGAYYSLMVLIPVLFIFASGSLSAYASLLHRVSHRFSFRDVVIAIGTLVCSFMIQNIVFILLIHHAEWNILGSSTTWKDPGNIMFLCVNPAMETFFWRVFMHRELAVRWFPSQAKSDEQLLPLTMGTLAPVRMSTLGIALSSVAFSLYHYMPIVMYDLPLYAHAGVTYKMALIFLTWLAVFGAAAIYVRERLGILAAWALHVGIDLGDVLMYTYLMIKATGHPSAQLYTSWE